MKTWAAALCLVWIWSYALAGERPSGEYLFDWSLHGEHSTRRILIECGLRECRGTVYDNQTAIFASILPLEDATSKIRWLEQQLAALPPCTKSATNSSRIAWRVKYFGASTSGSASTHSKNCPAVGLLRNHAESWIAQIAASSSREKGR